MLLRYIYLYRVIANSALDVMGLESHQIGFLGKGQLGLEARHTDESTLPLQWLTLPKPCSELPRMNETRDSSSLMYHLCVLCMNHTAVDEDKGGRVRYTEIKSNPNFRELSRVRGS